MVGDRDWRDGEFTEVWGLVDNKGYNTYDDVIFKRIEGEGPFWTEEKRKDVSWMK